MTTLLDGGDESALEKPGETQMTARLMVVLMTVVSLSACGEALSPEGEELATTGEALTHLFGSVSSTERGMGLLGLESNGVVQLRCSAAFLRNDWLITRKHCVESIPSGARLVASNGLDLNNNSNITPALASMRWVRVAERSALSWDPDLALVHLESSLATGRAGDPTATTGFFRFLSNSPMPMNAEMVCLGFSMSGNLARLGARTVRIAQPGAQFINVTLQFGEGSMPSDDGGACFLNGQIVAVLRHVDSKHIQLRDVSRVVDMPMRGEVEDAIPALAATSRFSLWPLTLTSQANATRCLAARPDGFGTHTVFADTCAPIWSQGFLNHFIDETEDTMDVQMRHRATGLCLEGRTQPSRGFFLLQCESTPSPSQTFRLFYLDDGSVQVLNLGLNQCMVQSSNQIIATACNNTLPGHRFWQGFGRR